MGEQSLNPVSLLPWALAIAHGVRRDCRFRGGSEEESELEGVATLAVVELCERFDESRVPPEGDLVKAFCGWATQEIRSRCRRAARQLRNAGLFRTARTDEAKRLRVCYLDDLPFAVATPEAAEMDGAEE